MRGRIVTALAAVGLGVGMPAGGHAGSRGDPVVGSLPAANAEIRPDAYRAFTLDQAALKADLSTASKLGLRERAVAGPSDTVVSLPAPGGGLQRFALKESPIMEAGLAAAHPEIKTYAG